MSTPMKELQLDQAQAMRAPKRWPLVNTLTSRDGSFLKDARLVNAYAEKDPVTGGHEVEKRPGFSLAPVVGPGGGGAGIFSISEFNRFGGSSALTILIQGPPGGPNIAYLMQTDTNGNTSAPVSLGPVGLGLTNPFSTTASRYPTKAQFFGLPFSSAGVGVPTIVFSSGAPGSIIGPPPPITQTAYYYDPGVGSLQTLNPGINGFPSQTVPGFVFLDGFTYVMDITGTIWQTATQNQIANWGTLAFIGANTDADIAVQLARQLIYVVAIKQWTTQFFYDAGNLVGSSLSPVPGAQYSFGCVSSDTFQDLDGVLFWVTQSKSSTNRVVKIDNLQHEFVSTPAIERQLDLSNPSSIFYSACYEHAGHRWYLITNVTTNVSMIYDIGEKLWYLWTDSKGNYYPVIARTVVYGKEWNQMGNTGAIYVMDGDYVYPTDFGNIVPVDIYTPNFDAGVDRIKMLSQMRFNADQQSASKLYVRSSDDDYQTWTPFRQVDLSEQTPNIIDEGSFYRRAYNFRHMAAKPLRIRSVDLQMDIGTL